MSVIEIFLIGVGLSMDAFAASVCKGLSMRKFSFRDALVIGLFFGAFQGMMPLLGWVCGRGFAESIGTYDNWLVFGFLSVIGGKMILEALKSNDRKTEEYSLKIKELFILAVATSIDALAVGVTFSFMKVNILFSAGLIAATTLVLSMAGTAAGNKFGAKYKQRAEIFGGIILILIGVHSLLEGLSVVPPQSVGFVL